MNFLKNIFSKKNEPIRSYPDFWNWFRKNEKTFFRVVKGDGDIDKDFFGKLAVRLEELRDGFYFLVGMYDDHTVELVLTADGVPRNIVFVEELVAEAPEIRGWRFTALKPATTTRIELAGLIFDERMHFYANTDSRFPDDIELTVVHDDLGTHNREEVIRGVYLFLDNYLGELNFTTTIDQLTVGAKDGGGKELIPIGKLKSYLEWRQSEFIEKYEAVRHSTEKDMYSVMQAQKEDGGALIAVINTDLLEWDGKASHPWILTVEMKFGGDNSSGMPDERTYKLLDEIEMEISVRLRDRDGYLNVGRETSGGVRHVYYACREFRTVSKVVYEVINKYPERLGLSYDIFKDKYWRSFERFVKVK